MLGRGYTPAIGQPAIPRARELAAHTRLGMRTALVMLSVLGAAAISSSQPRPALLRLRGGGPTGSIPRSAAAAPLPPRPLHQTCSLRTEGTLGSPSACAPCLVVCPRH
jgi:hypothetical protein